MFGKKKGAPEPQQRQVSSGAAADGVYGFDNQPNNQPRTYSAPTYQGKPLPGHAGYVTYKLRGRNAMTDIRFNYVRPDGKAYSGPGRYAK